MEQKTTFGKWLKRQRRLLDLTQEGLAEQVGCSLVTIRKFESDERRPSKQLAQLLAVQLQIPEAEQPRFVAFARAEADLALPQNGRQADHVLVDDRQATRPSGRHNLPAALTSLVGRQEEIETICQMLLRPGLRLLTLTGPGGSGKTRLAQEVGQALWQQSAQHYPDGLYFVNLAPVSDPALVIPAIADMLELKENGRQPIAQLLNQFLRPRRLLLILDNFEQVIPAGEALTQLLQQAAGLQLLITSRALLQLYGEHEYPVLPLGLPNLSQLPPDLSQLTAITLFVARAQAVKPTFSLTQENGPTIAEICVRLDGLPLAIELAAARSKLFSPTAMLAQLNKLDFLASPHRHVTGRQRTLRGTIDWSFQLLEPKAQQHFRRLGVFAGPFSLAEAQAITDLEPAVLELLTNQSMVQQLEDNGDTVTSQLLFTLREYALEQLTQANELTEMQARHAQFYLSLAQIAANHLTGPEQAIWLRRLDATHDNLRAALAWSQQADPPRFVQLALSLAEFWRIRGYFSEGRAAFGMALTLLDGQAGPVEAQAFMSAGVLAYVQGDYAQAHVYLEKALGLWHDPAGIALTLFHLGRLTWTEEQYPLAWQYTQQALEMERTAGNVTQIALLLNTLGLIASYQGQSAQAIPYFEESLILARQVGNKANIANCLNNLGARAEERGDYRAARRYFEESLTIFEELGYKQYMAITLGNLGSSSLKLGDLEKAEEQFQASLALRRRLGARLGEAQPLQGLGTVAAKRQNDGLALHYYRQSLAVWQEVGRLREVPILLEAIGGILARMSRPEVATQLMGAAEAIREAHITAPHYAHALQTSHETITLLKEQFDFPTFRRVWQSGREMTIDQAIALANQANPLVRHSQPLPPPQRYLTDRLLAVGGMGEVYLGRDSLSNTPVVIKRLKPELVQQNREMVARFAREGELLRQLNHPNIVKMLAAFQGKGEEHLLVLEYVSGGSLRELLTRQPQLPIQRVVAIGLELADALTRAHHLHIIHRDLKPENVLLAEDGTPRLTDFGISYQLQPETRLTQPGVVMGTTAYVGPEGFLGQEIDARSDIWSFGVILYEMLAGRHPFQGDNLLATLNAVLQQPPPDLARLRPETPTRLVELINQMLDKNRAKRPGTMRQVAARLEQIFDNA